MSTGSVVNVRVHLVDAVAPSSEDITCPGKIHTTLLHNETSHALSWAKPTVNSDNCPPTNGAYPQAQEEARNGLAGNTFPEVTDQYDASDNVIGHTGQFPVGAYEIDYS